MMQLFFPSFLKSAPVSKEPKRLVISCANEAYEILVQRHPRARRYTLRVREARRDIVLTIPPRGSLREAHAFAERNANWIATKLKKIPEPVPFADGETIPFRGILHRIEHRPKSRGTVWPEISGDGVSLLCVAGQAAHISRRVRDFLKREARQDLLSATRLHARKLGVEIDRVGLRDSTSRWGSCSYDGSLSYSWRLIMAPSFVLDYLAAHEVAHRRELNHSARFWRVVDELTGERRRAEAWLKAHGNSLHRYGAKETN